MRIKNIVYPILYIKVYWLCGRKIIERKKKETMKNKGKIVLSGLFISLATASLASCRKDKAFGKDDYKYDGNLKGYSITFKDMVYTQENGQFNIIGETVDTLLLNAGTELKWLPTPKKEGYKFVGWYLDENLGTPFYHKTMTEGDLTAYARWELDQDVIYVHPDATPLGKGTENDPMALWDATRLVKAGAKIVLTEGTYQLTKPIYLSQDGSSSKVTTIEGNGSIIDFKGMREDTKNTGITLSGDYNRVCNLTIKNTGAKGILVGSDNNVIENVIVSGCKDTGVQIARANGTLQPSIDTWPSNNQIINCTSINNADTAYEDADGFAAKLTVGQGNVFDGCIAAWNADDGWDLYAKQDTGSIGAVTIRNCLSLQNGRALNNYASDLNKNNLGDGNGFKLGGTSMPGQVVVDNCIAAYNYAHGFTDNSNPGVIAISNCTAINNGRFVGETEGEGISKANTKSYSNINLNRDGLVQNKNFYENILSFYDKAALKRNTTHKGDEFNGSLNGGILYSSTESPDGTSSAVCYKLSTSLSVQDGKGFNTSRGVEKYNQIDTDCDFTDPIKLLTTVGGVNKFHKALRNEDGTINLKNYYKSNVKINDKIVGASLNKTSWSEYTHNTYAQVPNNETENEQEARNIIDTVTLSVNPNYIYNDIYLPISYKNYTVSWKSSDNNLISINNDATSGTTVKNVVGKIATRLSEDKTVTLTATVKVGKAVQSKDFVVTLKKFEPRIGETTGIEDVTVLNNETLPDIYNYKLYDYTSDNIQLTKGTDYKETVTIYYQADRYETTSTIVNAVKDPGFYTIKYNFSSLDDFYTAEYKCNITIVNSEETNSIIDDDNNQNENVLNKKSTNVYLNTIIENKMQISGYAKDKTGTLYAIAVKNGATINQDQILSALSGQKSEDIVSDVYELSLSNYNFKFDLNIDKSYNSTADLYMFIKNKVGNGELYSITNIEQSKKISTYEQLYDALRNQNNVKNAYELVNDIDCSVATTKDSNSKFNSCGLWEESYDTTFKGYFNGNGFKISNLVIRSSSTKGVGLFTSADNATIKNIKLEEVHVISSTAKVGVLVGNTEAGITIENIEMYNCSAKGYERVAGLLGEITGTKQSAVLSGEKKIGTTKISGVSIISDKPNDEDYTIQATGGKYVGGILAHSQYGHNVTIENCFVNATIKAVNQYGGGIVGRIDLQTKNVDFKVDKCIFTGRIFVEGQSYMGGIFGGLTSGTCSITNVVGIGSVSDSTKKKNPIVSTNFCNSTTIDVTKYYTLKDTFEHSNWYYLLPDYDYEIYGETYKTEAEYIEAETYKCEWYGQYKFRSEYDDVNTWKEIGFDMDNVFEFHKDSTYGFQFKLKALK